MLPFAFPVLWRDRNDLRHIGVIDIQSSDFSEKDGEEILVQDVIVALNKRLETTSTVSKLREVCSIMLYGVRLNSGYPLRRAVPQLDGSSPRFVATTQMRARCCAITVFVKTMSGKTISIVCSPEDTVNCFKAKIEDKENIRSEHQRLMFAGKPLENHHSLSYYNLQNKSVLHLVQFFWGGALLPTPRTFADVSNGSILTVVEFSAEAPEWRFCSKGLNIEGRCKNRDCRAFGHMIIDRKEFALFNLIQDDNVQCPICRSKVDPVTCGLYDCCWRYEGTKAIDGVSMCSKWKDATGDVYHRFECDEKGGSVEWESLLMAVKPRGEATKAKLLCSSDQTDTSPSGTCTMCWYGFGPSDERWLVTSRCGHVFHSECSEEWNRWCERNSTQPCCPICRRTG